MELLNTQTEVLRLPMINWEVCFYANGNKTYCEDSEDGYVMMHLKRLGCKLTKTYKVPFWHGYVEKDVFISRL